MIDFDALQPIDYLRSGAVIIAFMATAFADKKGESTIWLKADAIACLFFGTGFYLFPSIVIEYSSNVKVDFLNEHLIRAIGGSYIALAIIWYYIGGTKDRAVTGAWLLMRTLMCLTLVMTMYAGVEQTKGSKQPMYKDQFYTFSFLSVALFGFGHLIHLFNESSLGSVRREGLKCDRINCAIIVDLLLVGTHSLAALAFSKEIVEQMAGKLPVNSIHVSLAVSLNVMIVCARLFSMMSMNFSNDNDKKAMFKAILWVSILLTPWAIYYHHAQNIELCHMWCHKLVFLLTALNAMRVVGCFHFLPDWCSCSHFKFLCPK